MTIGNLPKAVRRTYSRNAYILVAYLPVLKGTSTEKNKAAFTDAKKLLYHSCMQYILKSLDECTIR